MTTIEQKILNCQLCPFMEYSFNDTKELGFGNKNRIMFVGSSPAITSNKSQGFGRFDLFFNEILSKVDITKQDYYFTNLVKTSIPKGVLPSDAEIRHCYGHLIEEILDVKPQVIVPLGEITRTALGLEYPYTFRNRLFKKGDQEYRTLTYAIAHPGMLHYKPEMEKQYLKNLRKILTVYKPVLL